MPTVQTHMLAAMWSRVSSLMLERINNDRTPHRQTDRLTGQTQTARETDTGSETDSQHTHKHLDKLLDAPRGSNRVSADRLRLLHAVAPQPGNPMRAGLADSTMGPKSLWRGLLSFHGDWTRHCPPSGRKPGSSTESSCANLPIPGIEPGPSDLQSGALPSEVLRQHAQFHHTFIPSEERSSVRLLHHQNEMGAGRNISQTMKQAASGGRTGGRRGRAARQGSKPSFFIVIFAARPIYVCRGCLAKKTFRANSSMHCVMHCARAQDSVSER